MKNTFIKEDTTDIHRKQFDIFQQTALETKVKRWTSFEIYILGTIATPMESICANIQYVKASIVYTTAWQTGMYDWFGLKTGNPDT